MFIECLEKDGYILGQVYKSQFEIEEEPVFEYLGETEESVREYLQNWITLNNTGEEKPEQEENNTLKDIMPSFDEEQDEDEDEVYTSIDEEEEEEEELEVDSILQDAGIDPGSVSSISNNGHSNSNNGHYKDYQDNNSDTVPDNKITIKSEWYSINNKELMNILQNHDKVQLLYSILKDTEFKKLFNKELSIEDLPVTPSPKDKNKKSGSGVGKGRGRRKQGKSGRDCLIANSSLAEYLLYLRDCEASDKTQKVLCAELDEKYEAQVATNSAFLSQDLAVMRLLDELSAEYTEVENWVSNDMFTWSDATAVMKAARTEPNLEYVLNLLKDRLKF